MWKQKLGISITNGYSIPTVDVVRMLAAIGFEAISPVWNRKADLGAIVSAAQECGMTVQSLHAPFGKVADMWGNDTEAVAAAKADLFASLEDAAAKEIPILVVHTWKGFSNIAEPTHEGLDNFSELVTLAEKRGVQIAFENTEGENYLFALMEHFKDNDTVGFCWDSGHEMCYNRSEDLLAKLGDRLIMTHLNDNLGIRRFDGKTHWHDDLHLLPYDGIADWDCNVARLKKSRPMAILNFELNISSKPNRHENDIYGDMSLERYFTEAYKRACRIGARYAK